MGNVMMEASQINYRGGVTKMSVEQALKETSGEAAAIAALQAAVGNLQTGKADLPVIAPEFDAETGVYAVGDLVMYQGKLYEFTTAHETAGDWNSTEVTEKTVSDEIDSLKSGLTNVNSNLSSKCPFKVNADNTNPIAMPNVAACVLIWVGGVAQPNIAEMYLYNGFNQSLQTIVGGATPKITPVYDSATDIVTFNFDNGIMYVIG